MAKELSHTLNTTVKISKIDIGLLNRIIIDDLLLDDQEGNELLKVTRLSAKFDIFPLFNGKIDISNVQLFGFNINLSKENPDASPNYQFIIDTFSKTEKDDTPKKIDLRINSILIRRGKITYNELSAEETPGRFNPKHIDIQNIIANISLKAFQNDSINASVKRLSIEESSGLDIKKLTFRIVANEEKMSIDNFSLQLPNSALNLASVELKYDSLVSFTDFKDKIHFSLETTPSYFTPQDISALTPALDHFKDPIELQLKVSGTLDQLDCPVLEVSSGEKLQLKCEAAFQNLSNPREAFIFGKLSKLSLDQEGIEFLFKNLVSEESKLPAPLINLGDISFEGEIAGYFTDLVTYGIFKSDVGAIKTDLKVTTNFDKHYFSYAGAIETDSIQLGKLLGNKKLGSTIFNANIEGYHYKKQTPDISFNGTISTFEFNDYSYDNISLDGRYNREGFNGKIEMDDPNGSISLDGVIDIDQKIPSFNFTATVSDFSPYNLRLTEKYEDTDFSVIVRANFEGNSIDNIVGKINVDSFAYVSPAKNYFLDSFIVTATQYNTSDKRITINSDFLKATLSGNFRYNDIPQSISTILNRYLPALIPLPKKQKSINNNFTVSIDILNTNILSDVFDIPVHLYTPSTIKGYLNDETNQMHLEGYFPRLRYDNKYIESGMFLLDNNKENFKGEIRLTQQKQKGAVNISLQTKAADNQINTTLNWGNNAAATYSGHLNAIAEFNRPESDPSKLSTFININPTRVILNDSIWNIHPAKISIEPEYITIRDFYFTNNERFLSINGDISKNPEDSLIVEMNNINIGYIFDIANVTNDVIFAGDATGKVYASNLLSDPQLDTKLNIKDFSLNNALLGDLNIYGAWHNHNKGIYLDAVITEDYIGQSYVKGYIHPIAPAGGLDLNIKADNLSIDFIQHYTENVMQELKGRVSGDVHFYGKFKELTLNGAVKTDASTKFDILNTRFLVNDTIRMSPEGIFFDKVKISDPEGNSGTVDGYVKYHYFKDVNYNLDIHMNNMLVMNTKETPDFPFYGTVYVTGNALLTGNARSGLNANVAVTTNRNTTFTYSTSAAISATSNQFITFVDKTPRRIVDSIDIFTHFEEFERQERAVNTQADIRLNLLVDATPDATMKIIIDPGTGNVITARGSGNIRTEFYNKGSVRLFGTYTIQQGIYKFSLQEIIRKDFNIRNGSSITFNGPPMDATLDIQASYTVSSASLSDLIPDASAIVQQPNIKVNCMMNLTGNLTNPTLTMNIDLPNEKDEIQTLVRNYISTEEQMNMQMLYLLGLGKFYMESSTGRQSDMMSSVLSSTLSGQLNNMLSHIIDNNNWNIGTNLSTGEKGWTDVEVEGILSGQLLNNRLLINGNFGYRDNPMSNSNFVGDFEAEYLLNQSGDIRLKAYNETNDRYYTKTNLTTQGVGLLFKKDFNKWNELFFWNKWKLKKLNRKLKRAEKKDEELIEEIRIE